MGVKNEKKPAVNRNPKKFSRGRYKTKKDSKGPLRELLRVSSPEDKESS